MWPRLQGLEGLQAMALALGKGALLMQLLNNSPNTSYHLGALRRLHLARLL